MQVIYADEAGVSLLQDAGALEGYDVTESEDLKDYLYDGEKLRTLSGRHLSKKRNHLHRFEAEYGGRWEYRKLSFSDRDAVFAFLNNWKDGKEETGEGEGVAADESTYDALESLEAEAHGTFDIFSDETVFGEVEAGGIFIDGKLKAFSIGSYNEAEKMAVIDIEKADPEIDGLYQAINQQFLLHAFPDAVLVNREDDVGLPGLRNSKLSYDPIGYARKFLLKQKSF